MKKETNFFKNCPKCNEILYYSSKHHLNRSIKNNNSCQSCFAKDRAKSEIYKEKLSQAIKKSWENADDRKKSQSDYQKNFWKNLSEEERKSICEKMSQNFNRSEDRINSLREISKNLWKNQEFRDKWFEANNSEKISEKRRNNLLKQLRDPNSKINSEEVKIKKLNNFKKNWANKTEEEKNKILKNLANTLHVINGTSKLELWVQKNISHLGFKSKATIAGYCVDIVHESLPIIIEVNGDFWHANPEIYGPDWINNVNKKTAQEIWNKDRERLNALKAAGYEIIVLWQKDIKNNTNYIAQVEKYLQDRIKK
jgi:very-short-patch-repair endonuclease